jgi:hypothetical protein
MQLNGLPMTEAQKYIKLMLAIDILASGKGLTGRFIDKEDFGRDFAVDKTLADIIFVGRRTFDDSDLAQVKAAFIAIGKPYPGPDISKCVARLLGV